MIEKIKAFILSVDPSAEHYFSTRKGDAYTTWQETGIDPETAGNSHMGGLLFQIDRFSKHEDDAVAKAFFKALEESSFISFNMLVYYEKESGYIHHVFDCGAA